MSSEPAVAVSVKGLTVEAVDSGLPILDGVELEVEDGQVLGVVGESGSGKTTTILSMLGYEAPGTRLSVGTVEVAGRSVLTMSQRELRGFRGSTISYVPQNAGRALNPAYSIERSFSDIAGDNKRGRELVGSALAAVDLPRSPEFLRRLPHQLSGGQQQRVIIAMALSRRPEVVVMDEPTTGLDVVTQASVIGEIQRLRAERGVAIVYVSHDIAVVAQVADRIAVMYAGRIVEEGPTQQVLNQPRHPYTLGLLRSIPDHERPQQVAPPPGGIPSILDRGAGCLFAARCELQTAKCRADVPSMSEIAPHHHVACFHVDLMPESVPSVRLSPSRISDASPVLRVTGLRVGHQSRGGYVVAAKDIDLEIRPGESVALVGESGSGKTTISRAIVGLKTPESGSIYLNGQLLAPRTRNRTLAQRRDVQYVFQDPFDALNPRRKVGEELRHTISALGVASRRDARREVDRLLELVRLPRDLADRRPDRLSGGERQRVALARALASRPKVLICDEITSALDVSVQAAILSLLGELRGELELSMLLITHDIGVVAVAADRVVVLKDGEICEEGRVGDVVGSPMHPYSQRLIAAAPSLGRMRETWAGSV